MMHIILKNNRYNRGYIEKRCEGFDEFKPLVEAYTPAKVQALTGISKTDLGKNGRTVGYEMNYTDPEAIFNEMTSLTSIYAGMAYERILS